DPQRSPETCAAERRSVSDLDPGRYSGRLIVSVDLPVVRSGESKYVLSMALLPETLARVLEDRPIPADWIVAIFDRTGRIIVRNVGAEQAVGQLGRPELIAAGQAQPGGPGQKARPRGIPRYRALPRAGP